MSKPDKAPTVLPLVTPGMVEAGSAAAVEYGFGELAYGGGDLLASIYRAMHRAAPVGDEVVERVITLLAQWEKRREVLNMIPEDRRRFIEHHAAALSVSDGIERT
jgi:hypothetical protein